MKSAILSLLFTALLVQASAEDSTYRATLESAHERYHVLDAERNDYRKPKPGLPAAQEEEYLRLLGQLSIDDPVWVITQQMQADIHALVAVRSRTPAESTVLEDLKDLLAITSGVEKRATTRQEAETLATSLRQFIARRDVAGARTWARSQQN